MAKLARYSVFLVLSLAVDGCGVDDGMNLTVQTSPLLGPLQDVVSNGSAVFAESWAFYHGDGNGFTNMISFPTTMSGTPASPGVTGTVALNPNTLTWDAPLTVLDHGPRARRPSAMTALIRPDFIGESADSRHTS
jgi:hypothetical protein